MNDVGYVDRKYILSFIAIFCLLLLFLLIFFYFNLILVLVLVGIIIICTIVYFITRNKEVVIDDIEEEVEDEDIIEARIQNRDSDFSLELFYVYVKEILDLICRSYSKRNVSFLDKFLGRDLKNDIKTKIESHANNGYTRMITGLNIRDCKLVNYYVSSGYEYFEVVASISKVDCLVQSGVVINGERTNGRFLDYYLVFCRSVKNYTPENVMNCPYCGADSSKFNSGKCMNCGQIVMNLDGFYLIKLEEI